MSKKFDKTLTKDEKKERDSLYKRAIKLCNSAEKLTKKLGRGKNPFNKSYIGRAFKVPPQTVNELVNENWKPTLQWLKLREEAINSLEKEVDKYL